MIAIVLSNIIGTWPPSRSEIAGAEPLYGTWFICSLVVLENSSPVRCCGVPLPEEAKEKSPFFDWM
ncbi:hypothetical protein D3C86_2182900 [compost metagenome]